MQQTGLSIGAVLGERYLIIDQVGEGGMGRVYLAKDLKLDGKRWAIKETHPLTNLEERHQFLDEMKILCALDHPQLPKLIDYFPANDQGCAYMVMDYIQGTRLDQLFNHEEPKQQQEGKEIKRKSFPLYQMIKWIIQLCDVLTYLHDQSPPIVHRDLKPTNIIVTEQEQIKLIDFGTSRRYRPEREGDTLYLGTIGFAAPEQYGNAQTDPRSDLYSLGALLYYLLTSGQVLGNGPVMTGDEDERSAVFCELAPDIPSTLVNLIEKATRYHPDQRYQHATELKQDLLFVLRQVDEHHGSTSSPGPLMTTASPEQHVSTSGPHSNSLVLIGSLWPQSGATTFGMNLSRALATYQLSTAFVEFPETTPYLFDYFGLEEWGEKAPFNNWISDLMQDHSIQSFAWTYKNVDWFFLDSHTSPYAAWQEAFTLQLLYALRMYSVVIIDISTLWDSSRIQPLMKRADLVLLCAEPDPIKMERFWQRFSDRSEQPIQNDMSILQSQLNVPSVELIAMKDDPFVPQRIWKRLGGKPLVRFPYIPYPQVMNKVWRSELIYDDPQYTERLDRAFYPLLKKLLSAEQMAQLKRRKDRKRTFTIFRSN